MFFLALIASLLRREGKQAKNTRQTDRQSIKLKKGAKYAAKKYLSPSSKMRGVTFHFKTTKVLC